MLDALSRRFFQCSRQKQNHIQRATQHQGPDHEVRDASGVGVRDVEDEDVLGVDAQDALHVRARGAEDA